ncbi:MAG: hypothetical protein M3Q00_13935 [Pseudomonadota bacterium]|nr:hypothetical protein [Pseudomonadota bacterium]
MYRRLAVVFLLLLVPLQLSWAAVTAYCEHETKAASHHIGHHEHKHQADQSNTHDDPASGSKSSNFDADCGICHAGCSMALCGEIAAADFAGTNVVFARPPTFHLTLISSKPERPKWLGLA